MLNCCECEEADCVHPIPRFRAIDAIPIRFLFVVVRFAGVCPAAANAPLTDMLYKYSSGTTALGHGSTTMILERVADSSHITEWERVSSITTVNGHRLYTYRLVAYNFGSIRFQLNGSGTGYELDTGTSSAKCYCSNSDPAKVLVHPASGYEPPPGLAAYQKAYFCGRVKAISETTTSTQTVSLTGGCYSGVAISISLQTFTNPFQIDGYYIPRGQQELVWSGSTYVPAIGSSVQGFVQISGIESHLEPESIVGGGGDLALYQNAYIRTPTGSVVCEGNCSLDWASHTSALTAYAGSLSCSTGSGATFDSSVSGSGV